MHKKVHSEILREKLFNSLASRFFLKEGVLNTFNETTIMGEIQYFASLVFYLVHSYCKTQKFDSMHFTKML